MDFKREEECVCVREREIVCESEREREVCVFGSDVLTEMISLSMIL
jgi:hypothetical protein